MSYEAWGDGDDGQDYDHLIDAGWWDDEKVSAVMEAIQELRKAPVYEDGDVQKGISPIFLMRMTLLANAAGILPDNDPAVIEAREELL